MSSQNDKVLELLRARGPHGLTALEALEAGAGMRLAARISDLRAAGHVITSETITTLNGARVARYVLADEATCPLCGGRYRSWSWHVTDDRHQRAVDLIAASHVGQHEAHNVPRKVAQTPENIDLWAENEKREAWGK